jgi:cytoskeleton protein RodZ
MKRVGQILKEERERRQISLSEIAIATKVNVKFLQAIEDGNLSILPQKTFLRGFVRAYARHLGIDVEGVLEAFQEEMGSTNPSPPEGAAPGEAPKAKATTAGSAVTATSAPVGIEEKRTAAGRMAIGGALLALIVVIFIVHKTVEKYERESDASNVDVTTGASEGLPASTPDGAGLQAIPTDVFPSLVPGEVAATTVAPSGIPPVVTGPALVAPIVTVGPTAAPTAFPSPTIKPLPTTKPSPSPSPIPTSTPKPTSAPTPSPAPKAAPQEVIVESLDNVTLEFRIDGGPIQTLNLKTDQIHTFKASYSVLIDISNGGAVNVIHNGRDRGVPGTLGKNVKLKFP